MTEPRRGLGGQRCAPGGGPGPGQRGRTQREKVLVREGCCREEARARSGGGAPPEPGAGERAELGRLVAAVRARLVRAGALGLRGLPAAARARAAPAPAGGAPAVPAGSSSCAAARPAAGAAPRPAAAELAALAASIEGCTLCGLWRSRSRVVFGEGDPAARLMFVGEGPGAEEDRSGRPFVGPAGRLLDRMIRAMGLAREQVYIANVVKCRPPGNRAPTPDEAGTCLRFLRRQIELVAPELIVALGASAARVLVGEGHAVGRLRGRVHRFGEVPVVVTYHPAYLLRTPADKRKAWEDLQLAMRLLGLPLPDR
ncbi:MAG: hypothetical protein KatS3mg102_2164 [Planctomycetota bacterium]|nr:MAG: hypothetical protein KatS3mg102_2164 [Planctomycetota bacterium]